MDLPIVLEPKNVRPTDEILLLAHVLDDLPLYFHWRDSVNDYSRDPEIGGFCIAPTAEEYEPVLFGAKETAEVVSGKTISDIAQTEQGIGFYWQDVYGGWQGPFTPQVLKNWKDRIPMDTALWHWDGNAFSEKPLEFATVIGEGHLLGLWRLWHPEMDAEKVGYGRGPTLADFEEEVLKKSDPQKKSESSSLRNSTKNAKKNATYAGESQKKEVACRSSHSALWTKEMEDEAVAQYASLFDEGDPTRVAIESGVPFSARRDENATLDDAPIEGLEDENEVPQEVEEELLRRQREEEKIEKMRQRSKFGDNMFVDERQAREDRLLYGDIGLWMDPSTVSSQMNNAIKFRAQKKDRATIQYLKERKRKVRAKMMEDWYHDDDDIGDLMYAREITDPRVKELLKNARKASDAPMSRRRQMVQRARERGEQERPDALSQY